MEDKLDARFQELEDKLKSMSQEDLQRVRDAYQYAKTYHEGQLRKDGSPYITHPLEVAHLVAELGLDADSIMAALLHDTIEDTDATYEEVAKRFTPAVADLVEGVTKLDKVKYTSIEEKQMENLRKMLMAMAKDVRVMLIKICDRVHNIRTMEFQSERKRREKSLETLEVYAPIAHRLGMQRMKWEMEDLSLKYLDPIAYKEIDDELDHQAQAHAAFMEKIQTEITARLEKEGIKATVYGRVKHIYSIYRKMYAQNKTFSEIFDLYAFRVIVDDIPTCYSVLGCIHDMYKAVLGRFKDYIGTPKPNMYQSLHTTVIGTEGIPFEVQIRTWDMHHMAEYGIAAHWKYKQGMSNKQLGTEETFAWVRRLLENQQDTDAEEYIRTLKVDLFADEVFVFTPNADVINLPAGATPIDFAYAIHSGVGNSMTGAKVNGRIVGFDYQLKSGEIVEVITSKNAKGPSRDWMKLAKSNQARTKIRQWFKREKREENVATGRAMFEGELKRLGITIGMLTSEEMLPHILEKVRFNSLEEMYAAIGYGGASAQKCANRAREELVHQDRQQAERLAAEKAAQEQAAQAARATVDSGVAKQGNSKKSFSGVIVSGMTECMVKFAKCCTPVPGDEIVGFITRGFGVSVHRCDCPNAVNGMSRENEKDRWIKVSWDPGSLNTYKSTIELIGKDRSGLALDVATILATAKINTLSFNAQALPDGYAKLSLVVEVRTQSEVTTIMNKLQQIHGIYQVARVSG
ncbi:MAG: bifunctional (p)ppGpp synthetase/guanosine-3',5'-bis(diphosphate) 3'-pyrophosphohydrolase [Bacillota bacterium]|nr:bifunctional (p)ppGpp synthetase/guanosine-3',5'-bis(diphosphate) 3'-pyrophosphohydrolase [Bacillota bacterium]